MKNIYQKIIFCLVIACPVMLFGQSLDTLSLEQLIALAEKRSLVSAEAKFDMESATYTFSIFKSGLKPQISGTARLPNYAKTSSEIIQPDGTVLFQPITNNNSSIGIQAIQNIVSTGGAIFLESNLQRFDNLESKEKFYNGAPFRLGIIQPLFQFNPLKWDKKIEPIKYLEAEKKFDADMEQIKLEATALFFNLLIAREDLNIAISNRENNQTIFDVAKERFELGKISENDLMALRLELVSASRNAKRAEQAVRMASARIFTFLGISYDHQMIWPGIPEVKEEFTVEAEFAIKQALANRPEVESLKRRILEAERNLAEIKGQSGLNADLTASIGFSRGATALEDIYIDPRQEQFVSISLSLPIVDWGRQKNQIALSKATRDLTQKRMQQERLQLETDIKQMVDQFKNIQQELALVKELKKIAQDRFEITKQSYLLSAISLTELTLAQREKDQAAREYIATLSQFWTSYYGLQVLTIYDFNKNKKINH